MSMRADRAWLDQFRTIDYDRLMYQAQVESAQSFD
jgi:hypothetical protein